MISFGARTMQQMQGGEGQMHVWKATVSGNHAEKAITNEYARLESSKQGRKGVNGITRYKA